MKNRDFSNRKNSKNTKKKNYFDDDNFGFADVKIRNGGKKSRDRDRIKRMRDYNE